ncbi:hypothetical protein BG004_000206, partial [Podila humilis]
EGGLILAGGARLMNESIPTEDDWLAVTSDVYKYEISTSTWSKLTELPSTVSTGYIFPVCAVSGNNLVVLGGFDFRASGTTKVLHRNDGAPIIYDLKQNAWQSTYTPTTNDKGNGQDQESGTTTATGVMGAATSSIVVGMMVDGRLNFSQSTKSSNVSTALVFKMYVVYAYMDYRKDFDVEFHGVFKTLDSAIEHAKTLSISDDECDSGGEYVLVVGKHFDRRKNDGSHERIAVDDIEYFDK